MNKTHKPTLKLRSERKPELVNRLPSTTRAPLNQLNRCYNRCKHDGGVFVVHQTTVVFVYVPTEDGEEREKVKKAGECCKKILNHVNQAVKEAENKQVQAGGSVRVKSIFKFGFIHD